MIVCLGHGSRGFFDLLRAAEMSLQQGAVSEAMFFRSSMPFAELMRRGPLYSTAARREALLALVNDWLAIGGAQSHKSMRIA